MIDYEYASLFMEHDFVDIIITDSDATITPVSNSAPTISDNTFQILTDDVIQESFELTENLCSEDNLRFGACEASNLVVQIYNFEEIPLIQDKKVAVYIYFNGDSDTLFRVGTYLVDSDEYSNDRGKRTLTMFDMLYYLRDLDISKWFNDLLPDATSSITIGDFREELFAYLEENEYFTDGVVSATLPNDEFLYTRGNFTTDLLSFGSVMEDICEVNGCFGHINREGKFVYYILPRYDSESTVLIDDDTRIPPTTYKDYTTKGFRYISVYDGNNSHLRSYGNGDSDKYSTFNIFNNMFYNSCANDVERIYDALVLEYPNVRYRTYKPCTVECIGALNREVGDRVTVSGEYVSADDTDKTLTFKTYILERHTKGLNLFRDTYSAKGEPRVSSFPYQIPTSDSSVNQSSGGYSNITGYSSEWFTQLPEIIRNFGLRLLDEPTDVVLELNDNIVSITYTDPVNRNNNRPCPVEYAGTVIVRKEGKPPLNRWDGTLINNSTTRNEHQTDPVTDEIDVSKNYFYGIFPYDTEGHYRYTKSIGINTDYKGEYPEITSVTISGARAVVSFTLPSGTWTSRKLVYKKNAIPQDASDGTVINLSQADTSKTVTLTAEGTYYFIIFCENASYTIESNTEQVIRSYIFVSHDFFDIVANYDLSDVENLNTDTPTIDYYNSPKVLFYGQSNRLLPSIVDGVIYHTAASNYGGTFLSFPLDDSYSIIGFEATFKITPGGGRYNEWCWAIMFCTLAQDGATYISNGEGTGVNYRNYVPLTEGIERIELNETKTVSYQFAAPYENCSRVVITFAYGVYEVSDIKVFTV